MSNTTDINDDTDHGTASGDLTTLKAAAVTYLDAIDTFRTAIVGTEAEQEDAKQFVRTSAVKCGDMTNT